MATRRLALSLVAALSIAITAATAPRSPLFDSHDVLLLRLEAPFRQLLARSTSENDESPVTGRLTLIQGGSDTTIDGVRISLRGHTSRRVNECTFPKLKVTLPANNSALARSALAGHSVLKIGTHCGESVGTAITAKYGRLANENSPLREAFVYRLLDAMDVPTLKARVARITYVYTDGPTPGTEPTLVRNGFIVEDDSDAVKRVGGVRQLTERQFSNARDQFAPADTALVAFGQALIGNFDWCLKMTPTDAY